MAAPSASPGSPQLPVRTGNSYRLGKGIWNSIRRWWRFEDIAYQNLKIELPNTEAEFDRIRQSAGPAKGNWEARIETLLQRARDHMDTDPDLSMRCAKIVSRELLFGADESEVRMRAGTI